MNHHRPTSSHPPAGALVTLRQPLTLRQQPRRSADVPVRSNRTLLTGHCLLITLLPLLLLFLAIAPLRAQITQTFSFTGLSGDIPDGDESGFFDQRSITSSITLISQVTVSLNVSTRNLGGFNGDLYVTLGHLSGFSVLLNRVGRTSTDPVGYADEGFNVTFDEFAANGDVHQYRVTLSGNPDTALIGPLTGLWAPDGRTDDPATVLDTSARPALLSVFEDLDANGQWTLFLADLESGGAGTLVSWELAITGVPEPAHYTMISALLLLGIALLARSRLRQQSPSTRPVTSIQ